MKCILVRQITGMTFLFLALLLGTCARAEPTPRVDVDTPVPVAKDRTVVVALVQPPFSLGPADHRDRNSETVIRNMFDGLVTRDTRNGVHLELAKEMNWLDDKTLEVRLRQGVLFHDGILDRAGQPLAFAVDTLQEWYPLATAVADQFRRIGVDASVRIWEFGVIRSELLAGESLAYLDDWGDSAFDSVGHFEAKWHGYIPGQPYGRGNFSGYNDEQVNDLIQMGERTADLVERQRIYDEAQQIIYQEAPAVFLILPEEIEAASVRLQNWEPASDSRINLHDVCIEP